jgi:hypothetical protein
MTIDERIEKLERGLSRAKRTNTALLIILCLAVAVMISGAAVEEKKTELAKEIRAQKILLEDENGKVRIGLTTTGDEPRLKLLDKNGNVRVKLYVQGEFDLEAGLKICDERGTVRSEIKLNANSPSMSLNDYSGQSLISFTNTSGMSLFALRSGGDSGPLIRLYADKSELEMSLVDEKKQPRIQSRLRDNGAGIYIGDKDGMNRAAIGCAQTKTSDGKTINYPESSILLFGPDGKELWEAPR